MIRPNLANWEASMRMKVVLGTVVAVFAIIALTTSSALAGGGPRLGPTGAGPARAAFTCERASARLARVEARIARIQARVDGGEARKPERAARIKQRLEKRAARIEARIAANC
jgi:hypothetical protein